MKIYFQTSIGAATGTSPMCKHACGMIRNMHFNLKNRKNKITPGVRNFVKIFIPVTAMVFLLVACNSKSSMKSNSLPTPADVSSNSSIPVSDSGENHASDQPENHIPYADGNESLEQQTDIAVQDPSDSNLSSQDENPSSSNLPSQDEVSPGSAESNGKPMAEINTGSGQETKVQDENNSIPNTKNGYVVVLDPGHGGNFTGAAYFGKVEKDLTLLMANYVRDYLLSNYDGIEVYLTRESDIALDSDLKVELEKRAIIAKEYNADFFISLHFNACEAHNLRGATVYASFREHVAEKSQGIAISILKQLVSLGLNNNQVKTRKSADYRAEDGSALDYYAVIRHSAARDIPGVIVEHCFMDNESDFEFIKTEEKMKELAIADAIGIADYLGLKTK